MAYTDFATSAPTTVQEALGLDALYVGPMQALAIREDSSHFFNRAGGFGAGGRPITADDLTPVCDFYREQGVARGSLMFAPSVLPADWAAVVSKLGLTEGSRYTKLSRDTETVSTTVGLSVLDPGW
ncbi:hypothetical protein [Actinomadura opuntiae]|uniref:hypothetical protein n=1 Tax=Actinomadura sp. OS1-43 TaxID=604315 RepID=UPI00255B0B6D|nr:hypothetical protein [Actinomadura sp. OS1-43]MDL4817177.1 hypothetical protein [Actinomadura sp. OS1-43]